MAKFTLKSPVITVGGIDLSDHFSEVSVEGSFDKVEVTSFGAAFKEYLKGMGDATMTGSVFQDFAAGEVDATLWPLFNSDTSFLVTIKPTSAAVSATNPLYSMTAQLYTYSPIAGAVGEAATTEVNFENASQTGLTRATA